jgi:TatD-related deoxyribonuclease
VALPRGLPVVDHHCHLSPTGEGVGAVRRFAAAGGTHLFLTTQNYRARVPLTVEEYREQFETTESLAKQIRTETAVVVYTVVAPYPVDLVRAAAEIGVARALEVHREALDLAGRFVRERRAVAIGEVGRPHFPIPPEVSPAIETALRHAFSVAREVDCPAVVHSADLDASGFAELAARATEVGLSAARVVKHYARQRFAPSGPASVTPSYLARRDLVRDVLHDAGPWFLETDFLDDPARPGAVLDLATIPRRAAALARSVPTETESLWVPFVESVEKVYGWRPEAPPAGPR